MKPENRLRAAIKQVRIARSELGLHPQWDGKLAEAEIDLRGVADYVEDDDDGEGEGEGEDDEDTEWFEPL